MNQKFKALIHDWDDTVVESFDSVLLQYQKFAYLNSIPNPTRSSLIKAWGKPAKDILSLLWPYEDIASLHHKFSAFLPNDFTLPPFPGVLRTIHTLHNSGYIMGVVSSSPKSTLIRTVEKYLFEYKSLYLFLHTAEDCDAHKPDPQVFNNAFKALNSININESQTIYIGDSLSDYYSAKARGIHFLAVTSGFTSRQEFLENGLSESDILNSFNELPLHLKLSDNQDQ